MAKTYRETSAEMVKRVPAQGVLSDGTPELFRRNPSTDRFRGIATFSGDISVILEVADTPELREKGLMGRDSLLDCCGMLFTDLSGGAFWMRGCKIPLDIVFVRNGRVTRCYSMKADNGARLYRYGDETEAIELAYGYCARNGIAPGTKCSWRTW